MKSSNKGFKCLKDLLKVWELPTWELCSKNGKWALFICRRLPFFERFNMIYRTVEKNLLEFLEGWNKTDIHRKIVYRPHFRRQTKTYPLQDSLICRANFWMFSVLGANRILCIPDSDCIFFEFLSLPFSKRTAKGKLRKKTKNGFKFTSMLSQTLFSRHVYTLSQFKWITHSNL